MALTLHRTYLQLSAPGSNVLLTKISSPCRFRFQFLTIPTRLYRYPNVSFIINTNMSLANPDLPRLPFPSCNPDEPPTLTAWLNNRLSYVPVSTLTRPDTLCSLCDRPMCDFEYLHQKQQRRTQRASPAYRLPSSQSSSSEEIQFTNPYPEDQWVITAAMPIHKPSKAWHAPMQPPTTFRAPIFLDELEHSCDAWVREVMCEIPVKISSAGCGHYMGHLCLEQWILSWRRRCPVCHAVWFQREDNRRQVMKESYPWSTERGDLRVGAVEVDKTYQGQMGRVVTRWGPQPAKEETLPTAEETNSAREKMESVD